MNKIIKIGNREIGNGKPALIIAEIGINYNGDLAVAKKIIDAATESGCDVAKFQSWVPDSLYNRTHNSYDILKGLLFPREAHQEMINYCKKKGIIFMSSAFSKEDVDFLEGLNVPAHKVASCELTNLPLLKHFARTGKPLIMSTGFGNLEEIREAVETIRKEGNNQIILLHCISAYPPKVEEINLKFMNRIAQEFNCLVGLSDHSIEISIPQAAVARGACVIEKHITLDRNQEGYDHKASTEPHEFKTIINGIRTIEKALGSEERQIVGMERELIKGMRKSILAARDIKAGEVITTTMVEIKRPGEGLPPKEMSRVLGKKAQQHIKEGDYVRLEDLK